MISFAFLNYVQQEVVWSKFKQILS